MDYTNNYFMGLRVYSCKCDSNLNYTCDEVEIGMKSCTSGMLGGKDNKGVHQDDKKEKIRGARG